MEATRLLTGQRDSCRAPKQNLGVKFNLIKTPGFATSRRILRLNLHLGFSYRHILFGIQLQTTI
jgi:hypothetical protein